VLAHTAFLRRFSIVLVVVLASLAMVSCGTDDDASPPADDGGDTMPALTGTWVLEAYAAPGTEQLTPAATAPAMLTFADGAFNGDTGCNVLNGSYTTDDDAGITFELGPTTMRACIEDDITAQEAALVAGLPVVTDMELDDDELALLDDTGAVRFVFRAGATGLEGTSWQVTGINTGDALESNALIEAFTLDFGADGTVSGNVGCNSFTGSYTIDGSSLSVSALASTTRACEPDVGALEQQYTAALEATTEFELRGSTLTLRDDAGAMQVTLTASDLAEGE
jgi:heat shock protein HslJ